MGTAVRRAQDAGAANKGQRKILRKVPELKKIKDTETNPNTETICLLSDRCVPGRAEPVLILDPARHKGETKASVQFENAPTRALLRT